MQSFSYNSSGVLLVLLLVVTGCTSARMERAPSRVWPSPPAPPRIAHTMDIREPRDANMRISGWHRMLNGITGSRRGRELLVHPMGLAVDEKNNLCLTDPGEGVVVFFDQKRHRQSRWTAIGNRKFALPVAVAKRGEHIYVADSARGSVLAFDTSGTLIFETTEQLERPSGLALSGNHLWVADAARHCLLKFSLRGALLAEVGQRGTGPGEYNFPTHLATDVDGRLFITDSMNFRIQILESDGTFLRAFGQEGQGKGQFSRPKGLAVNDQGHIFVADALFDNVQIFDDTGQLLLYFGETGTAAGDFWLPSGVATDHDGRIYVADSYNHRIQTFQLLEVP